MWRDSMFLTDLTLLQASKWAGDAVDLADFLRTLRRSIQVQLCANIQHSQSLSRPVAQRGQPYLG